MEHIGGAAEDEDYAEEDFVMDVDVFLPFSSSQIQCPKQPPLPDYLPLELHAEPDVESGECIYSGMCVCWDSSLCVISVVIVTDGWVE